MKKYIIFFIIITFAIFAGGVYGKSLQREDTRLVETAKEVAVPTTPTPTQPQRAKPAELSIPKLNIQTPIEYVGNDAKGNMDTPKDDMHVAWYEPGFLPGVNGNAVLAGHFDRKDGGPAVFYNLEKLEKGDEVIVTDKNATLVTFVVVEKQKYPTDSFPIPTVFGPSEKPYLNLVTCGGVWDPVKKIYAERLVVRTLLQEE